MKKHTVFLILFALLISSANPDEILKNIDIPQMGQWMLTKGGTPANWLGQRYRNKELLEPINLIIIDEFSITKNDAIRKLLFACKMAGYKEEMGHSSGYWAVINGIKYPQIPFRKKIAFSDHGFLKSNNHGRIMGPCFWHGKYIFIGAFSRESISVLRKVHHQFVSFNVARDSFCKKLESSHRYRIKGNYNLSNAIDSDAVTTADHDGNGIVLEAID